ncbi:TonB-dependent receptor [Tenacibaculum finnmarkense genomovar finnmarkense]|nr:TonB-dependent receptor [Tenacibaculum finnmarkense]MCD8417864.1 TonB-dependent receptor [Tenacibaculum finnmarkense genomovar finnmarkense]MCG8186253.1 TonB-dependent receptor [Tenacibaculum finnmarkense genomovar finnmarkense]MCG8203017.1 TonB-dependent receptor [Tenacibaculum finnmarkense genomovar finnmarkense]MCG8213599.1 TonB-dependent receptor [Tenacibaculum finnmarkense genomovar finnmarkense]MCG8220450.1 TonB-dependent receptor [Tenacibaculum finnmarkense genomovar finnmarkense]
MILCSLWFMFFVHAIFSQKSTSTNETETQLSEVIINAKHEKKLGTHKVSKIALKLRPINSAHDFLKTVPGLFIAQHAGGGKAEQIFLRGFDNDHGTDFAVLVDDIGINLSSHAHGQGYADLHFLIPETVQTADYYKGPHETSLGNFAVSGAALFTSKDKVHRNFVKLEYGQYDFARALAMVSLIDKNNFLTKNEEIAYIAIEGTYNDSFFESEQRLKRLNTFTKYTVVLSDIHKLRTSISTFHSTWNASGQVPLRAVKSGLIDRFGAIDDNEGGDTERVHFNIQLNSNISEKTQLTNQLYYVSNIYNLFSNFTFYQNNPIDGDMIHQQENRKMYAYKGNISIKNILQIPNSTTTFGWETKRNNNNIGLNNAIGRTLSNPINEFDIKETNVALFLKERIQVAPKLTALAGIRADYFDFNVTEIVPIPQQGKTNSIRISPKFSLFYDATKNLQLYAKASSGFHSNYANAAVKNKEINPLPKAVGYDIGTEFKIGKNFVGNIATFYLQSDAEFVFVSDGFEFENKGRSKRIGSEASFRYQPLSYFWLDTDLNYSFGTLLDAPKEENKIPSAPRFTSTGGATFRLKNGINTSLRYRFLGERPLIEDESVIADSYFIADFVINYTKPKYQIGLSVENIFNTAWREAVFYDSSQLQGELQPVDDIHFTPGTPFLAKLNFTYFF